MTTVDSWQAQTMELLELVRNEIAEIEKSLASLKQTEWAIEQSLRAYTQRIGMQATTQAHQPLTPRDVENKTQKEILRLIAERGNGILVAKHAVKLMKDASLFPTPENASSQVYNVLRRNPEFARIRKGVYKLTRVTEAKTKTGITRAKDSLLRQAILGLRQDQPDITKEQVLEVLIQRGFDFHGKVPSRAVNMVLVSLGRRKKELRQIPAVSAATRS